MPILEVKNLKKYYPIKKGIFSGTKYVRAVDNVSLTINKGETLGLVGESGCGKTTLGKLIVKIETPTSGKVILNDVNTEKLSKKKLRESRKDFQMIFQDPYSSLNPRINIIGVLNEVLSIHTKLNKRDRYLRAIELLNLVGLKENHLFRYPHQFSGGQRQRIGIARALAVNPKLIVADEPISALDVSIQAQIINLLCSIQKENDIAFLFIAHDLVVVEHISAKIMVMYLGKIVEYGESYEICNNPKHPYTLALIQSIPSINSSNKIINRKLLSGDIPSPLSPPKGCSFHPRCSFAIAKCKLEEPALNEINKSGHFSACFVKM